MYSVRYNELFSRAQLPILSEIGIVIVYRNVLKVTVKLSPRNPAGPLSMSEYFGIVSVSQ